MQCPSILGNGATTQRLYCDVLGGTDPAAGLRVTLPPHAGPLTLSFTLHNRQTYSESEVKAGRAFARYTATLRVASGTGDVIGQAVVRSEFRTEKDLVERIAGGAGPGGVKAVAPTGAEPVVLTVAEGVDEVILTGERLSIERVGGTEVVTAPGRPYAVVSGVEIEYRPAPPAPPKRNANAADPRASILVHILAADDDAVSRTLLARTLEHWGHEVEVVDEGLAARRRLVEPGAPTLAILDWGMPGLEGPEICRQVRAAALRMQPYLVMLTARRAPEDLAVALEAGADDFLSKPFNRVELMARLHAGMRILNLHRALTDRIQELEESRQREHHLRTLTPICWYCKRIRGDKDDWEPIDRTSPSTATASPTRSARRAWTRSAKLPPMPRE